MQAGERSFELVRHHRRSRRSDDSRRPVHGVGQKGNSLDHMGEVALIDVNREPGSG
jgi:hypothetical protein